MCGSLCMGNKLEESCVSNLNSKLVSDLPESGRYETQVRIEGSKLAPMRMFIVDAYVAITHSLGMIVVMEAYESIERRCARRGGGYTRAVGKNE